MDMICRQITARVRSFRFPLVAAGLLSALAALASEASAALIFNSVRFDVNVRSGSTTDVEEHFTNDDFPPVNQIPGSNYHSLPAINANLAGSLQDTSDLRMQLVNNNGNPVADNLSTIWITSNTGLIVNNPIDTTIALPITFETVLYDNALAADEKLVFPAFKYEPPVPFPNVESVVVSDNRGSQDDPITVTLKFEVGSGHIPLPIGNVLKIHFYWERMDLPIVPEPSTALLALVGLVGTAGVVRRRGR
jgi:hypothetical protein